MINDPLLRGKQGKQKKITFSSSEAEIETSKAGVVESGRKRKTRESVEMTTLTETRGWEEERGGGVGGC